MSGNLKKLLCGTFLLQEGETNGDIQKIFYHRLVGMCVFNNKRADEEVGWDSERVYFITDRVSAQRNIEQGTITSLAGIMPSANISPTELFGYTKISKWEVPEIIKISLIDEENKRKLNPPIDSEDRTTYRFVNEV